MSYVAMSFALALGLAPFLDGQIARVAPWRGDFLLLALLGAATAVAVSRGLKEAHRLPQGERRARLPLGEVALIYGRLARDSRFLLPTLMASFGTGLMVLYGAISPFDFEQSFGFSQSGFGLISLSLSVPYLLGALVLSHWVVRLGQQRLLQAGLGAVLVGALAVGIPISSQVPLALALLAIAGILALLVRAYGRLGASR
jgi:predicted MFS family arabinose efflux permease